jgi:hypothetical protein
MLGRTILGLLGTQAHAGRRAALGTIRRTATWAEHRHQCLICITGHAPLTLHTRDALDALGSLWTCGALWSGLTLGAWVPHAAGVHLCHRGTHSEWTIAFVGLWRLPESPLDRPCPDSGKARKRVLGVPRCPVGHPQSVTVVTQPSSSTSPRFLIT